MPERPAHPRIGILGIGSALAPHVSRQMDLLHALIPPLERRFCIPDFRSGEAAELYDGAPRGLERRMRVYQREAPALAASACERALKGARVETNEITHLVVATCTGIFTPGPDVELATRLRLRPEVERTIVGFM